MEVGDLRVDELEARLQELLRMHESGSSDTLEFLRAQYDLGLAWVHFPVGLGGLDLPAERQGEVDTCLDAAGAPLPDRWRNVIGFGMAAPTLKAAGTTAQMQRYLRSLFSGEEIWCQLFSEPGAGSDLASLTTRADWSGSEWIVSGQKVWTSGAHIAQRALLLARTDSSAKKHSGLTYFIVDMNAPGVDVRGIRQLTGEADFNEVFLDSVRVPDSDRLGEVGDGWRVATTTLQNERVSIGTDGQREAGQIGVLARECRQRPELLASPGVRDRVLDWWVEAEATRLAELYLQQLGKQTQVGLEGAALKVAFAHEAQEISGLALEIDPDRGLLYDDWSSARGAPEELTGRGPGFRYLRARGNSIEGGTSEVLRNIVAERVLGLPREPRVAT